MRGGEFHLLMDYQLLQKDSGLWSYNYVHDLPSVRSPKCRYFFRSNMVLICSFLSYF